MTWFGFALAAGTVASYLGMLVVHRFTYRSWIFHIPIGLGTALSAVGWATGGQVGPAAATLALAALWIYLMAFEMRVGSPQLPRLRVGDSLPAFEALTVAGAPFNEADLARAAPALLQLYRGWWCPTSALQLEEILSIHNQLDALGVTTFAASVDSPDESAPLQQTLGSAITVLCSVENTVLDVLGVEDRRGAAWYSRLLTRGVQKRPIALPSAIAVDATGTIVYSFRTNRVDERANPNDILAAFTR